jgi:hypothetical protein
MKKNILTCVSLGISILTSPTLSALEVEVQRVTDEGLPWGWTDVSDFGVDENPNRLGRQNALIWDHSRSIQLSEAPYVDYMVAFNSGTAGILAEKVNGPYLEAAESTVASLTGGSNGGIVPDPEGRATQDRYSSGEMPVGSEKFGAFASWTDGFPLPSLNSRFGVSWGGGIYFGDQVATVEMEVRVNLASEGPVNVAHFFNDGWYYTSDLGGAYEAPTFQDMPHPTLEGHEFTVTHYAADGTVIEEMAFILPSGGGTNVPGVANEYADQFGVEPSAGRVREDGTYYLINDWRQFYTAFVRATRQAEGDYLILHHRSGNLGYRLTAVTLGDGRPWDEGGDTGLTVGEWNRLPFSWVFGLSPDWGLSDFMAFVYTPLAPYIYQPDLGWLYHLDTVGSEQYFFSFALESYILIDEQGNGFYYIFATNDYSNQIPQP